MDAVAHDEGLSIGELAEVSGVAVETIRAWERRYGRPAPLRRPSGHRRYSPADARWLRRVADAVARGARPSAAVRARDEEIDALLARAATSAPSPDWMRLAVKLDAAGLRRRLRREASRRSVPDFVARVAAPLATEVGRAWSEGRIGVRHEHLVTSVLSDELRRLAARRAPAKAAATVVLATLPGERHALGLEMAAAVAADAGATLVMLGPDTPLAEIAACARDKRAAAVAVSVSQWLGRRTAAARLAELRGLLPRHALLVAGGAGTRRHGRDQPGVIRTEDFDEFRRLLTEAARP